MLWYVLNEQPNTKDMTVISLREGMIMTSRVTAGKVFGKLLPMLVNSDETERQPLVNLVTEVKSGLVTLFGENCSGVIRLKKWLEKESMQSGDVFTRQMAIEELRDFFPTAVEMEEIIFKQCCLDDLDKNIRKGIANWNKAKPEEAGPSSSLGPPPRQLSLKKLAEEGKLIEQVCGKVRACKLSESPESKTAPYWSDEQWHEYGAQAMINFDKLLKKEIEPNWDLVRFRSEKDFIYGSFNKNTDLWLPLVQCMPKDIRGQIYHILTRGVNLFDNLANVSIYAPVEYKKFKLAKSLKIPTIPQFWQTV
ncbi:unnamed protein product [Oikopleura dioica]|uniref:Uncharacterized protein n=1 Tax=Oikopleura dioica TaxID=34765 RepID=E4XEX0_OIKDI|nr:unnamed protein product [Oikopleura dioica]